MKKTFFTSCLYLIVSLCLNAQTTKQLTLSNGDGWYRIIEGTGNTSGFLRLSGGMGNNKNTDIRMYISIMAYSQGGSINIIDNKFYNQNHIDEIRAGTINGKYIVDIYLTGITNPATLNVTSESATILNSPIYNPSNLITGKIEISGKVIGTSSTRWPIFFSEKVGIGTTTPDSKLTVKGNIHTNEVKVDLLGAVAPDYVFENDYYLKPLKEVENYITKEKHLPNIPSAKNMETDGINLKEFNLKLLEKIEELTLYTIQ